MLMSKKMAAVIAALIVSGCCNSPGFTLKIEKQTEVKGTLKNERQLLKSGRPIPIP